MQTNAEKSSEDKTKSSALDLSGYGKSASLKKAIAPFGDVIHPTVLQNLADNSSQVKQLKLYQQMANSSLQGKDFNPSQAQSPVQMKQKGPGFTKKITPPRIVTNSSITQLKPDQLKSVLAGDGMHIHFTFFNNPHNPNEYMHITLDYGKQGKYHYFYNESGKSWRWDRVPTNESDKDMTERYASEAIKWSRSFIMAIQQTNTAGGGANATPAAATSNTNFNMNDDRFVKLQ